MDSSVGQLERLLKEGANFTFANFSIRDAAQGSQYGGADSPAWLTWKTRVFNTIHALLEEKSAPVALLKGAMDMSTRGNLEDRFVEQKSLMLAAVEQTIRIVQDDAFGESKRPKSISSSSALSNRIFVVHGHDHATKTELEVFLTSLGIEPVVLHRQPDQGRTLIEKFEQHADVGFAFILLTPDDVAYKADQETLADVDRKKEFRARLGRRRVCCLVKGEVARPSDIDGLVYKAIPESIEAIGFSIIKELKAAGYTIKI